MKLVPGSLQSLATPPPKPVAFTGISLKSPPEFVGINPTDPSLSHSENTKRQLCKYQDYFPSLHYSTGRDSVSIVSSQMNAILITNWSVAYVFHVNE